jgi:hypothetical protein
MIPSNRAYSQGSARAYIVAEACFAGILDWVSLGATNGFGLRDCSRNNGDWRAPRGGRLRRTCFGGGGRRVPPP